MCSGAAGFAPTIRVSLPISPSVTHGTESPWRENQAIHCCWAELTSDWMSSRPQSRTDFCLLNPESRTFCRLHSRIYAMSAHKSGGVWPVHDSSGHWLPDFAECNSSSSGLSCLYGRNISPSTGRQSGYSCDDGVDVRNCKSSDVGIHRDAVSLLWNRLPA